MPLEWSTSDKEAVSNGVKVCIYGPSGMGKTLLCATAPRPIILSAESGLLSLNKANIEKVHGVGTPGITYSIPVIKIKDLTTLHEAFQQLTSTQGLTYFDTLCLDSISEIAEVVLSTSKRTVKDIRQAYGELIERMESLVRVFRDIPGKNVYFAAKSEPVKDELSGMVKYSIAMPGQKLGPKMPFFFDEIFFMGAGIEAGTNKPYRYLLTQPDPTHDAKDRSGRLEPIEYPHLGNIFKKISGVG